MGLMCLRVLSSRCLIAIFALSLVLSLTVPFSSAAQYHTTLLTVSDISDEYSGGTADLYLEVRPGEGRIYIDSFPVSKIDTQFSTRFANEIACDLLREDCDRFDFFYTIRADSSVVGGPSAGAATTLLTIAALEGEPMPKSIAVTGTINSGGLVGPVAGIIPKALAAKDAGIELVLIPALSPLGIEELRLADVNLSNASINYSVEYDVEVLDRLSSDSFQIRQVTDIYEALEYTSSRSYVRPQPIEPAHEYLAAMQKVSLDLCARRDALVEELLLLPFSLNVSLPNASVDENIARSFARNEFYSAASFCFSDSINLRVQLYSSYSDAELKSELFAVSEFLSSVENAVSSESITTIGDVETLAIVRERILEAKELVSEINASAIDAADLAYAYERVNSADAWSAFFSLPSEEFSVSDTHLEAACYNKLSEAEERITYIESYLPARFVEGAREELSRARSDIRVGEWALCLFKASKAKAEANILATSVSVSEERLELLLESKVSAAEVVLARQAEQGLFPIMGYSYYEYAKNLRESNPYSALTFIEYSLELSNLHLYFPQKRGVSFKAFPVEKSFFLIIGFFLGVLCMQLFNDSSVSTSNGSGRLNKSDRRSRTSVQKTSQKKR